MIGTTFYHFQHLDPFCPSEENKIWIFNSCRWQTSYVQIVNIVKVSKKMLQNTFDVMKCKGIVTSVFSNAFVM